MGRGEVNIGSSKMDNIDYLKIELRKIFSNPFFVLLRSRLGYKLIMKLKNREKTNAKSPNSNLNFIFSVIFEVG